MDEIGQDPKLNARIPRGRWLDVAIAVTLIAAAAIAVMTGRGSRPAASPAGGPGTAAAPALLPSTGRTQIPLPFGQPGGMTILDSTAWISDWSASQVVGVDLAARRVTRTLHVGDWQDEPVSMTSGAGSLWVLDFSGPLLRIDPASGAITKRFPVRGLGADVAYGDGFIWMITDEPAPDGGQEYLYKIDPSRNVIVKEAPVPGAGQACAVSPGPQGIWIGCAGVDRITVINQRSLQPAHSLRVDSGGYIPQIVPGRKAVWVLTPSGLARADPATARITAIIRTGYAPSALSAPALIMDSADRLWITGSLLAVVVPGTLTAYPVARTRDLISAAADGPTIWVDTGSALVRLQVGTPHATGATANKRPPRSSGVPSPRWASAARRSLHAVLLAGEQAVVLVGQELTGGPSSALAGPTVVPGPYPDRTLSAHICRVPPPSMTKLCSSNLIAGCREPDWAAPAFTGSGQRRFSTQISTQKCGKRIRNVMCPGHSGQLERSARMRSLMAGAADLNLPLAPARCPKTPAWP